MMALPTLAISNIATNFLTSCLRHNNQCTLVLTQRRTDIISTQPIYSVSLVASYIPPITIVNMYDSPESNVLLTSSASTSRNLITQIRTSTVRFRISQQFGMHICGSVRVGYLQLYHIATRALSVCVCVCVCVVMPNNYLFFESKTQVVKSLSIK